MYDPVYYLKEARRLLKRHGTLIITVPFAIKLHQEPLDYARHTKHFFEKVACDEVFFSIYNGTGFAAADCSNDFNCRA